MSDERKTLEQRAQMTDIERLRHSTAHVLATAILKIWPEAQFAAGPPVENGFYYDVDLPHRISPDDFEKIEAEMKKEIKANHSFERMEVSRGEALELGKKGRLAALSDRDQSSKYKIDIIENIPPDEKISLYRNGDFIDLCAGPHVMRTGNIGAFRLTNVASAYYKGDEKNPQLQRVYGTAFKTKKELDDYFAMIEEAKKRDRTPNIAREYLYKKSGHLPYYSDSMFPPMELTEKILDTKLIRYANISLDEEAKEIYATIKPLAARFQAEGKEPEWEDYFRELPPEFRAKVDRHSRALLVGDLVKQIGGGVERYYLKEMNCL